MNKRALTLFEILIAMIILAFVVAGLANVFVAGKRYIQHSRSSMTGGELGKYFLDHLQNDVNQGTWSTTSRIGANSATPPRPSPETKIIDGKSYTGTYIITSNSPANNINKVKVTISLPGAD